MVLPNMKKIWAARMASSSTPQVQLTNIDGTSYQNSVNYVIPTTYSTAGSDNRFYIAVGSGDTPPTSNDLNLENEITLTNTGTQVKHDNISIVYTATITNNTGASVTVNEYGLKVYSGGWKMLTRTVLESPITLEDGEVINISIAVKF